MAKIVRIYSENNDFQYLETLRRNRTKRSQTQTFFVEGVNAINQSLTNHWLKMCTLTRRVLLAGECLLV